LHDGGLGVDVLGMNCSLSPDKMIKTVKEIKKYSSTPIMDHPNAGLPKIKEGVTYFESSPKEFAAGMRKIAESGATIIGGCCGTTSEHIAEMIWKLKELEVLPVSKRLTL
jgi:5-methyltetrahydrofolate--homocysteine methyltransferase